MRLSDAACRRAKAREKAFKISDGDGLFLQVKKNGSKLRRQAYRFDGKQKLFSLGPYPAVMLAAARAGRDANKAFWPRGSIHLHSTSSIAAPRRSRGRTRSRSC